MPGAVLGVVPGVVPSAGPSRRDQPATTASPAPSAPPAGSVPIRYLANATIVVRGPATRREYRFSGTQPRQHVAKADVEALIASGHFTRDL